jgi:hypothetical protein
MKDGGAMYKLKSQMAAGVKELKDDKRNQELELALGRDREPCHNTRHN